MSVCNFQSRESGQCDHIACAGFFLLHSAEFPRRGILAAKLAMLFLTVGEKYQFLEGEVPRADHPYGRLSALNLSQQRSNGFALQREAVVNSAQNTAVFLGGKTGS